jgi:hypothetical protein
VATMAKCTTGSAPKWDWRFDRAIAHGGENRSRSPCNGRVRGQRDELWPISRTKFAPQLLDKRDEVLAKAKAATDKTIVERRTAGVEEHHLFAFGTLEKLRMAIAEHQVKGSVKELREMIDLFQKYLEAAETSYGLEGRGCFINSSRESKRNGRALHIAPPSKAEEIEVQSVRVDYHHSESKKGSDAEGSESIFDPETDAEGMEKEGALLGAGDAEEYRNR